MKKMNLPLISMNGMIDYLVNMPNMKTKLISKTSLLYQPKPKNGQIMMVKMQENHNMLKEPMV